METLRQLFALDDQALFERAREAGAKRPKAYWSPVVLNGACKTDPPCRHCKWESFKSGRPAFDGRRPIDQVLQCAETMRKAGATHLLVASGWMGHEIPDYFCDYIRAIKSRFDMEVYGLFGAVSEASLRRLRDAGMDGYQCGLESPDEEIYRWFRPGGDSLEDRMQTLKAAKRAGLKIWSGLLLGFGLSDEAVIRGLAFLKEIEADWVAIQPFVPFPHTQLQAEDPTNPYRWARIMAIARLWAGEQTSLVATENSGAYLNFMDWTGANAFFIFPQETGRS
ncbi:MAG: radical SAM protein [Oscillospiraceae bacterium]|jgi:biotin synthase|nr:radical SAM protein [Oscillospiraceae bacterium]